MYLVTYFVTNFVSFSVRKYSHFSSPYLVMYLVIYFVTFLVKSHVLLYWRSIIGATKYRTYLDCLLMQFYGDFKFNLALVVSSLIINISCPLLSFGAEGRSHLGQKAEATRRSGRGAAGRAKADRSCSRWQSPKGDGRRIAATWKGEEDHATPQPRFSQINPQGL